MKIYDKELGFAGNLVVYLFLIAIIVFGIMLISSCSSVSNDDDYDYKSLMIELSESDCGYSQSIIEKDTIIDKSNGWKFPIQKYGWRLKIWSGDRFFNKFHDDKFELIEMARYYFTENDCNISPAMIYLDKKDCAYQIGDTLIYNKEKIFVVGAINPFERCCCSYSPKGQPYQSYSEYAVLR